MSAPHNSGAPAVNPGTRPDGSRANGNVTDRGTERNLTSGRPDRDGPGYNRPGEHRPGGPHTHPREMDWMDHGHAHHFYGHDHHYFGHRVHYLPSRYHHCHYWGIDYYLCDGIYYRMYNNYYVVCRPPFGVVVDRALADASFAMVNFAYYNNVYRTYNTIDENNRTIIEQNATIAANNALIAQQNSQINLNTASADNAYTLATRLGLTQSYAYANQQYYYNDGVFYIINAKNEYEVIVPPAGALVEALPDDYDVITIDGVEVFKVDNTIYRATLLNGTPCLEVLGQLNTAAATQYNLYN